MNLLSLFSGIGAFEKALDNEGIKYNLVNYCEIDKYASRSYAAIHNISEELNLIDVTKVDTSSLSDIDLITYGFPCQDISQAGNQKGFTDKNGERTRSGLFFEALRIIKDLKPKYAIAENVKALTSKKFKVEFETVLSSLNDAGYNSYYDVLNAKDYGIPQNRERVFIVSIRKDVDDGSFCFPKPQPLNIRLKDVLEENVDEKFYLSQDKIKSLKASSFCLKTKCVIEKKIEIVGHTKSGGERSAILSTTGICNCLSATDYKQPKQIVEDAKVMQVGNLINDADKNFKNPQRGRVYDSVGLSPCLSTMQGGGQEPKILNCNLNDTGCNNKGLAAINDFKVRKLTPLECWRLMGFSDEDFEKAKASGISNSQLYKQAGNSIVVTVLQGILKNLFKNKDI